MNANEIKVLDNQILLPEQVKHELQKLKEFQITIQEMKNEEAEIKEALLKAMEENGVKSFENDIVKFTYIAPTTRKTVDTNALKEQGLYDSFTKETPVKSTVKITYK